MIYDINITIQDGNTPLHCACSKGKIDCVKLLLSNGADPTIKNKEGKIAADQVQLDDNNRATILHLIKEAKKGNVVYHSRYVLTV